MMSRLFTLKTASRRAFTTSAARKDLIQDFYSNEIKSFKPRVLSDKDAEGSVLKWTTPAAAKPPTDEINVSDVDSYAKAPVEVEGAPVKTETAAVDGDWFPIESCDELDAH